MLINPFNGVTANVGNSPINRLQKAVEQLSSGAETTRAADNVSDLSVAATLQNQVSGLRSALTDTSLFTSLTQTAEGGATQIQDFISQLQELAVQANSGALSDSNRQALDVEFQNLISEVNRIANTTQFNDTNLLDGSISGDNALDLNALLGAGAGAEANALSIESLAATALLGSNTNVATQESAEQALGTLQQALNNVGTTIAGIGSFSEQVEFASAFLETAIGNQDAARSTLSDADFTDAATDLSQANLQENIATTVDAQVRRLPPSLLELYSFTQG